MCGRVGVGVGVVAMEVCVVMGVVSEDIHSCVGMGVY